MQQDVQTNNGRKCLPISLNFWQELLSGHFPTMLSRLDLLMKFSSNSVPRSFHYDREVTVNVFQAPTSIIDCPVEEE